MAGALSAAPAAPADNMPMYSAPQNSGANPLSQMGYNPYGIDPLLYMAMQSGGTGGQAPQSSEVKNLYDSSQALLGNPADMTGALSRLGTARDQAAQQKLSSIDRAMSILQGAGQGGPDLVRLMQGSALMAPTRTGTWGESASNAGTATAQALMDQRAIERQQAAQQAQLALQAGQVPSDLAQAQAQDFYKQVGLGQTLGEWAARTQAMNNMAQARASAPVVNAAARISAAQIAAGSKTGRYRFLGAAPDGTGGVYLDTVTGSQVVGQGVQPKPTDFETKYSLAKALYPDDPNMAYQAAIGKHAPTQQELKVGADKLATEQLDTLVRQGQTPDDPQAFVTQTSKSYLDHWNATPPAHAPTPAAGASAPQAQHIDAFPTRPTGVPGGAQYSPSKKQWWWQENGKWAHN